MQEGGEQESVTLANIRRKAVARSADGNYKNVTKDVYTRKGESHSDMTRRTLKGALTGAEKLNFREYTPPAEINENSMKKGGSVKSAPKMKSGGSVKSKKK